MVVILMQFFIFLCYSTRFCIRKALCKALRLNYRILHIVFFAESSDF